MFSPDVFCKGSLFLGLRGGICNSIFGGMGVWVVIVLLGHFFLRVFEFRFGVWDVEGMVSNVVVVVSRTELVLVSKGEKIDMMDEESALLDDATEIHRLLDVEAVVSIKGIDEDSDIV
ncbi:hypothetical protein TNCV_629221 [Trichonephila clavipes]|nr:hypothetical protein TNCV_629221 [Trichonephila clavipes]